MSTHTKASANSQDASAPLQSAMLPFTAQAALMTALTVKSFELTLQSWRDIADSSRLAIRAQQDAWLMAWRTSAARDGETQASSPPAWATSRTFLGPAMNAFRSYEQMSAAMLQAQRDAFASMTGDENSGDAKPH